MAYQIGHPEVKQIGSEGKAATFEGKRCLVTGASSGIGYGIAERLLQRGAKEVWICSRDPQRIGEAAERLQKQYGRVVSAAIDVTDAPALNAFVDKMAENGPIDYVFANAGINIPRAFDEYTDEEFYKVMNVNFFGVYNTDRAVINHMKKQGFGYILNVSSMEGYIESGYHTAYAASKHAVLGLTESLRFEYAPQGIKFSTICPGPVKSNIWGKKADGRINPDAKAPAEAISELESADEIFAGIEEDRNIIIVTDTARISWDKKMNHPDSAERWMVKYTARNAESRKNRK